MRLDENLTSRELHAKAVQKSFQLLGVDAAVEKELVRPALNGVRRGH
jgi:hypothetical protein